MQKPRDFTCPMGKPHIVEDELSKERVMDRERERERERETKSSI